MFSQTTEYVLRVAVCLALTRDRLVTVRELTGLTGVPQNYLSKVLMLMAAKGLVSGRRGVGGGYRLAVDPEVASVLSVLQSVGELNGHASGDRHAVRLAPLQHVLSEARAAVTRVCERNTLADVAKACAEANAKGAGEGQARTPTVAGRA